MVTQGASLETIEEFLAQKRIAMAGISRDPANLSVKLFEELCRRGYDVVPVNPKAAEVQGRRCFARVQDIQPPVEAALLMTSPEATEAVVNDCAAAGVRRVWMYRGTGKGSVNAKAVAFCQEQGIQVVPGQCPFMFLPDTAGFHRLHGLIRKVTGRYPRRTSSQDRVARPAKL
jgi:predicted CoA-binding protein